MKYKKGTLRDLKHVANALDELVSDVGLIQDVKRCPAGVLSLLLNAQLALLERAIDRIESNHTRKDELA